MNHEFRLTTKQNVRRYDFFMLFIGAVGPLLILPQVWDVLVRHQTAGVSVVTWGGLGVLAILWIIYGVINRERAIIFTNVLLCILDFAVAIGVLFLR